MSRLSNIEGEVLTQTYYDNWKQRYVNHTTYNLFSELLYDSYVNVPVELIILGAYIFLSVPINKMLKRYRKINCGHKLFIILLGTLFGMVNYYRLPVSHYTARTKIYAGYHFSILCPVMINHIAGNMDLHVVAKCWHQILIIGVIRFAMEALIVGMVMTRIIIGDFILFEDIIFGFIVSPISPFVRTGQLKRLSKFKHIGVLLEMEGMVSYILAELVIDQISINAVRTNIQGLGIMILLFLKDLVAGFAFGLVSGKIGCILMRYLYTNPFYAVMFSGCLSFLVYNIANDFLYISGPVAILVVGIQLAYDRPRYTSEVNKFISYFWTSMFDILEVCFLFVYSTLSVERILWFGGLYLHLMLLTYLLSNVIRLATYLLVFPIVYRIGYGLNIRCMLALSLSCYKDVINMILASQITYFSNTVHVGNHCVQYVFVCVIMSHLFNNSFVPKFLKMMGLTDVSTDRKLYMDNCMRHIMDKRNIYLSTLKSNRHLSDANWTVVESATLIRHPYGKLSADDLEDDWKNRKAQCPDCDRVFFVELSESEKVHVKRSIFLRVLKMQKISFIRQAGEGMLSKDAIVILLQAIESAVESPECILNIQELFKPFHKRSIFHFMRRCLTRHTQKRRELFHTPRKAYRKFLYNIVSSMYFEVSIYVFILFTCVPVVYDIATNLEEGSRAMALINVSNLIVLLIYWLEFTIKILAYSWVFLSDGFRNYFRSVWNVIDFIIIIISSIDVTTSIIHYVMVGRTKYLEEKYFNVVRSVRMLRLIRLLTIFRGLIPKLVRYVDGRIESKLALGFDIGKGLLASYEDVYNALDQLVGDATLQNEIKAILDDIIKEIMKDLIAVTKDRPWIAIAVKTKQCIRTILKNLSDGIEYLRQTGNIDPLEYSKIINIVDRNREKLQLLKQIPPCVPRVLFNELLWLNNDSEITEYLFNFAEVVTFEKEETIFEEGQRADGIYLIIEGSATITYGPREGSSSSGEYDAVGRLPIIDYVSKLRLTDKVVDVIMRGNSFGELSVLSNRPYACTITTDNQSVCKCYYLSIPVVYDAFKIFDDPVLGLQAQMWKFATIQLSQAVLHEIPVYESMSNNDLKYHLARAFMPVLSNFRVFIFIDLIEDLVLLDGKVMDENTRVMYLAPCYIPRTVRKLTISEDEDDKTYSEGLQCKILVIPMEEVSPYEVMEGVEEIAELVDMFSENCVANSENSRRSKAEKKSYRFQHRVGTQRNVFGGLRSHIQEIKLFDQEILLKKIKERSAQGRKTSVFFTKSQAMKNIESPDE